MRMRSPGERSIWKAVTDNVTFDLLAHESIFSPGTDRIVDGGMTSFTRFSIVASEF